MRYRWRTPVTGALIGVNIAWFLLVEAPHGWDANGLLAAGALAPALAVTGQWYRCVSAMFVHMNFMHLTMNMVSLWFLRSIEPWLGKSAFFFIYWIAGVAGFVLSANWADPFTVFAGASGAVFGIFGVALYLAFRGYFHKSVRNQMLWILGINGIYDIFAPGVDVLGHAVGLAVGAFCTAVLYRKPQWKTGRVANVAAIFALAGTLWAFVRVIG
ncbi:hypothetical protein GCM10025857_30960 [Alicyclobacillus contaminans]|uniref:rhomboid family intramembrane serine protease n=1 Tax=Alicyclobacillus contaminans TaxID=392016 RepID=UPI00040B3920|nr:rhomboid family intramembrane serine protease [Alicyclobacillus contaminans]GMA51739.1 hypothetical protein GCM10025857_30960 [Alicyclobacillus contaminans]